MNVKYNYIRLAGLMGKVIVLDEVHSYDAYTGSLMVGLIRELRAAKCVVIILSATLTREAKAKLLDANVNKVPRGGFPMITSQVGKKITTMSFRKTPSKVFDIKYVHSEPYAEAVKMASKGANVVWFENSVNEGVGAYGKLKRMAPSHVLMGLLHSRYVMPRRSEIEKCWTDRLGPKAVNRPRGCILVVTQIGEQSLDVDFDVIVSRLAPSDFLIQRLADKKMHFALPFFTLRAMRPFINTLFRICSFAIVKASNNKSAVY
jgi:CRISPR-associated endonuclease/helicase Cas3